MESTHYPRRGLTGFFLSGLLLSFVGAILPAWRYHIHADYRVLGEYFLAQAAGLLVALWGGPQILAKRGARFGFVLGSAAGFSGILLLAFFPPPSLVLVRLGALVLAGFAAGLLNASASHSLAEGLQRDRASTLNMAGLLFGLGCLASALLVSGTFFAYTVQTILFLMALIPGVACVLFARAQFTRDLPVERTPANWRSQFGSFGAVVLALFLFFQFGNEFAIASWLPLFLIQRIGLSPESALTVLALFWLALLLGRFFAQWVLPRVSHTRLLLGALVGPLFGCSMLFFTNNVGGAIVGVLLAGGGYSLIYPLAAEKAGARFPGFQPGFYNGIFAIALTGALLAPASLGVYASWWGIGVVMLLPMVGSLVMLILLGLLLLDARVSG